MNIKTIISIAILLLLGSFISGQCIGTCNGSFTSYGENAGIIGTGNSFFGKQTGASIVTQGVYNTFMGYQTGYSNTSGTDNSFFGTQSGFHNMTGSRNSFFGRLAGQFNTADDNSFFGYSAGDSTTTGKQNSFYGSKSGRSNVGGNGNSFFGSETGSKNTSGTSNSFFGRSSGVNNETGGANSFFGSFSGASNETGNNNSFYGTSSGSNNETGGANSFFGYNSGQAHISGSSNSFFGLGAGQFNTHGARNSFFGTSAGNIMEGSHNIAIGHNAGATSMQADVDSTLYIDVERTDDPLIYGQFNKRIVRINGSFEAMGGVDNSSDVNRKEGIVQIDELRVLEKVSELELSEWSYKDASNIRHLGPMAQDFYKAFGLGKSDKTISTLDADGVALASIQALYQLWQDEKEINKEQNELIQSLLTRLEKLESE